MRMPQVSPFRNGTVSANPSQVPVAMIVNYSELCAAGFDLREVIPLQIETVTRSMFAGLLTNQDHVHNPRWEVFSFPPMVVINPSCD